MAYLRLVLMPFLFQLQFTSFALLWMLASLLIGLGYAFLLYKKKSELSQPINRTLFTLRTIVVAAIAFLLFAPLIRTEKKSIEKPLIFVLLDNSASIKVSKPSNFDTKKYEEGISDLIKEFNDDYEVKTLNFGKTAQANTSLTFEEKSTNITSAFKHINDNYLNRNIGAIILATDGIYNDGGNPQYEAEKIKSPVYAIALGDTIPKKDLVIANVNYNNLVYLGNDFQIEIDIEAYQSRGNNSRLSINSNNGKLLEKPIPVTTNEFRRTVPVILPARKKGIQKFTVNLSSVPGELSNENNTYTFFVEVIDGKQKVYILANSAHPDISAIKQSIESNKNFEVNTGFINEFKQADVEKSNLLILHQLPSANTLNADFRKLIERKNCWYILGDQGNVNTFSSSQNLLEIATNGVNQESFASLNNEFYEFTISEVTKEKLKTFPPLLTPFGNYTVKTDASILLQQQIGKISTDKPLLLFSKGNDTKTAVLCGEGIWRWRMEDFKNHNSHIATDELISKTAQYLSNREVQKKFRVYPAKNNFDESEHIVLNAELYNNSYELVNTPDVSIALKNGAGKSYSYLFSKTRNSYTLNAGTLPYGEYIFKASTRLGQEKHFAEGRFVISHQLTELRQTTANHQLLYNLAEQSNGEVISPFEISGLAEKVKKNELVKAISYENRRYEDLVNIKLLFFIILAFLSFEWFLRKRNGEL